MSEEEDDEAKQSDNEEDKIQVDNQETLDSTDFIKAADKEEVNTKVGDSI